MAGWLLLVVLRTPFSTARNCENISRHPPQTSGSVSGPQPHVKNSLNRHSSVRCLSVERIGASVSPFAADAFLKHRQPFYAVPTFFERYPLFKERSMKFELRAVVMSTLVAIAAAVVPSQAFAQNPPPGAIFDLSTVHPGAFSSNTYNQFSTNFVADNSSEYVSFAFREAPAYF